MHGEERKCGDGISLPDRLGCLGERRPPAVSRAEPQQKAKTISVHFVTEKLPLVNGILLSVAKCCVSGLR